MKARVEAWLAKETPESVIDEIESLSEEEREAIWPLIEGEDLAYGYFRQEEGAESWRKKWCEYEGDESRRRHLLRFLTVVAGPADKLGTYFFRNEAYRSELVGRVFKIRGMPWRRAASDRLTPHLFYRFVESGIIDLPVNEAFLYKVLKVQVPYDFLKENSSFAQDFLWQMFALQGTQEDSFANVDKYRADENSWAYALLNLADERLVPREKLLKESLISLNRGFIQYRAGWFSRLHESLKPSLEERAPLAELYLDLLHVPITPTVVFAAKALSKLQKAQKINDLLLLENVEPILRLPTKSGAKVGLDMLKRIAQEEKLQSEVCAIAATGVRHEHADIQAQAINLIQDLGQGENLEEVLSQASASVQVQFGPTPSTSESKIESKPIEFPVIDWSQVPLLRKDLRISPIRDVDELFEAATRLVEGFDDPIEFELVLDGFGRLHQSFSDTISEKQQSTLIKRCRKKQANSSTWLDACHWLLPILDKETPLIEEASHHFGNRRSRATGWDRLLQALDDQDLWFARFESLLADIRRGHSRPLLSLPSHGPYWVDAKVLDERTKVVSSAMMECCRFDLKLAQLRSPQFDSNLTLEIPFEDSYIGIESSLKREEYLYHFSVAPKNIAPYCRLVINELAYNHDFHTALWDQKHTLAPLFDHEVELVPDAQDLLVMSLGCKEAGLNGMAVDLAILAIEDGRCSPQSLGQSFLRVWALNILPLRRHAKTIIELSEYGPLHQHVIIQAIEIGLAGIAGDEQPRDLATLLDAFYEIRMRCGGLPIKDSATRSFLENIGGKGKAKKLSKALLELEGAMTTEFRESVQTEIDEGVRQRKARWEDATSS